MDELPRAAKELLALARESHGPEDGAARERVRRGVALAVMASAAGTAATVGGTAAKAAGFAKTSGLTGAKAWFWGTALASTAALGIATPKLLELRAPRPVATATTRARPPHAAPAHVPQANVATPLGPEAAPAEGALDRGSLDEGALDGAAPLAPNHRAPEQTTPRAQSAQPATTRHKAKRGSASKLGRPAITAPAQGLGAEMALLRGASAALEQARYADAATSLNEHAERFTHGQLNEEREGLRALLRCMRGDPLAAKAAERFVRSAPDAVLSARIKRACKLGETP